MTKLMYSLFSMETELSYSTYAVEQCKKKRKSNLQGHNWSRAGHNIVNIISVYCKQMEYGAGPDAEVSTYRSTLIKKTETVKKKLKHRGQTFLFLQQQRSKAAFSLCIRSPGNQCAAGRSMSLRWSPVGFLARPLWSLVFPGELT